MAMNRLGGKRLRDLQAKFPLTEKEQQTIQSTADGIWSEVAYDALEGSPRKTLSRATVLEIVMDAGRLEEALERFGDLKNPAIAALFSRPYDTDASIYLYHLLTLRFTDRRYGL